MNNAHKHSCNNILDEQLRGLLFDEEDRQDVTELSCHVETCESCQLRLSDLVNAHPIEAEASQLLAGYHESDRSVVSNSSRSRSSGYESDVCYDQALLEPPTHPEMLGRIGRYEVERCIGSGGMGVVFKAFDTELNRPIAVKVLAPHLSRNGAARQRFSRESRAAAAVVHEHVVAIHNVEASAEHPYLVMQYVSGESLQARVDREGPLSPERILRIGIQAALGLSAAHQQGIIHRDIKPANILLEDGVDRLLITDFGLARTVDDASLTHTGVVAGTPNYMSPEQAQGDAVDPRTDLFSLGSVLYFVATGHPPFRAEKAMGVLHRICTERHRPLWHVNPSIPDDLVAIIDRLLEKRPSKRFASAAALADSLQQVLQQRQNRRPRSPLRTWIKRHQTATGIMAGIMLFVTSVVGWLWFFPNAPAPSTAVSPQIAQPAAIQPTTESIVTISDPDVDGAVVYNRTEFNETLDTIRTLLNRLEEQPVAPESDSFGQFRRELHSINESLNRIDPRRD